MFILKVPLLLIFLLIPSITISADIQLVSIFFRSKPHKVYKLYVETDKKNNIIGFKTRKNNGKLKLYPLSVIKRKLVLMKALGKDLVFMRCHEFNAKHGCKMIIDYPYNIIANKFISVEIQLKKVKGIWKFLKNNRPFKEMVLEKKDIFDFPIGIKRINFQ